MNARNTLFIHLLCWNAEYGRDLVDTMLKSVFMHDAYVTYIALIKSVISCPENRLSPAPVLQESLLFTYREEDNDDLVPILEQHSDKLRSLYGDFYISELISRHPESERVIIVCEKSPAPKILESILHSIPKWKYRVIFLLHEPHYTDSSIKLKDPKDKSRKSKGRKLSVRPFEASDLKPLKGILEYAPRKDNLIDLFKSSLSSHVMQGFTLLSENQPMGAVVVGPLEDGTAIRIQYELEPEPRKTGTDGTILAGVMSPAFEPHARWFMRELLRHSTYTTLFWICTLFSKGGFCRKLMSLAGHMNPVHPRQSVLNISGNKDLEKIYKDLACPFALWVLELPLTSLPKVYVSNRIVVVGASRTGLAFLETLLMGPTSQYLTFSNVTLISEHGLPTVVDCLKAADICVPRDGRYSDRKRKCIHLKDCGTKYYDELVLTCGQQFQHPDYLKESLGLVKEVA
ncbi:hypothetical protein HF086_012055 [Spodoptera exigua]|uniref:Cilia- and flagella-associated protein 61 N-terminal domain-containing protein n=1 Tax=Spodoptera exigua TaxID=7107 RepID=A0A922SGF7_SPOEX|nr:hypothetical protein HF086_012055 [Spodoptera exigua]